MLGIPKIKKIWEGIKQNKRNFNRQLNQWIDNALKAIAHFVAYEKNVHFSEQQSSAISMGIIAKAFRYGLDPTDEKQRRMAAAYLLESYIDTPSSSLSGSLWWKEVSPC